MQCIQKVCSLSAVQLVALIAFIHHNSACAAVSPVDFTVDCTSVQQQADSTDEVPKPV